MGAFVGREGDVGYGRGRGRGHGHGDGSGFNYIQDQDADTPPSKLAGSIIRNTTSKRTHPYVPYSISDPFRAKVQPGATAGADAYTDDYLPSRARLPMVGG